jgi:hypothetical protein
MPMPQQLPQIPILPTRYPDLGKTILHQQLQNMLRILPIRLLLALALPGDLAGVPDPQLEAAIPDGKSIFRRDAKLRIAAGFGLLFPKAVSRFR